MKRLALWVALVTASGAAAAQAPAGGGSTSVSDDTSPALGADLDVNEFAIEDGDGDTRLQLEKTADDDTVRIDLGGRVDALAANYDGSDVTWHVDLGANGPWPNQSGVTSPSPGGQGWLIQGSPGSQSFQTLTAAVMETTVSQTASQSAALAWTVMSGATAFGAAGSTPTFLPSGGLNVADYKEVVYKGTNTAGWIIGDFVTVNHRGTGDVGIMTGYYSQLYPGSTGSNIQFGAGYTHPGFYSDGGEGSGSGGTMDRTVGYWYMGHIHDDATYEVGFLHDNCDLFNSLSQCTGGAILGPDTTGAWAFLAEGSDPSRFEGEVAVGHSAHICVSSPPAGGAKGEIYCDSDLTVPCWHNGTNWVQMDDFSTVCS